MEHIVTCQVHHVLVKTGQMYGPFFLKKIVGSYYLASSQEANLVEEVEDSPDFWSGPVQSYNSPVEHRFLIGLDQSTNGPLLDCDRKYISVRTMPPGLCSSV